MKTLLVVVAAASVAVAFVSQREATRKEPLIVHEWGTLTTQHGPDGTPRGRLNRIITADTLPSFVHRFEPAATQSRPEKWLSKGSLTPGRPDVTMRLETPVLYFHAPMGAASVPSFDVSVRFRGGIVNEMYPEAETNVVLDFDRATMKMRAGAMPSAWSGDVLNNYVVGTAQWRGVTLRDTVPLVRTASHVWLAPRNVRSSGVITRSGESERYLFYRGVAHLDALMRTELLPNEVRLRAPQHREWMTTPTMTIPRLWLVDIQPGGTVAFREHEALAIARNAASQELARMPLFSEADYAVGKLAELHDAMKRSLMASGLYDDEAEAMLDTWKASYFQTPGLRLFYLVPNEWLDYYLPLTISAPHELKRVLVGRIDLLRSAPN